MDAEAMQADLRARLVFAGQVERDLIAKLAVRGAELDAVRAELEECRRRSTTGGVPPGIDANWARGTLPPPPSASDPNAPTHNRDRTGGDAG